MCWDWPWTSPSSPPSSWTTERGTPGPLTRAPPRPPLPAISRLTISAPSSGSRPYSARTLVSSAARVSELTRVLAEYGLERSEEHTSELQSHLNLVCRLLLEKKKKHQTPQ